MRMLAPLLFALAFQAAASLPENGDWSAVDFTRTAALELRNPEIAAKFGKTYLKTEFPAVKNCYLLTFGMPGKASLDTEVKTSGPRSLRFDCGKGERMGFMMSMPAKPMQLYKATFWVKCGSPLASVSLTVWSKRNCGGTDVVNPGSLPEAKDGFNKVEFVFSSKEEGSRLDLYFGAGNDRVDGNVPIWFDDIKVEEFVQE